MTSFASRIREIRKNLTMSQNDFSKLIGVSKNTVSIWERGERLPSSKTIAGIAKKFNFDESYVWGYSDDPGESVDHSYNESVLYDDLIVACKQLFSLSLESRKLVKGIIGVFYDSDKRNNALIDANYEIMIKPVDK